MPRYLSPDNMWAYDKIQFARLIAEAEAAGMWNNDGGRLRAMLASMDLDIDDLAALVDRAQSFWDTYKGPELRVLAEPLTVAEARGIANEASWIEGVVAVDLSKLVDGDLESVLDLLGEALVDGGELLSDINYSVVGEQGNTLYVLVSGDASLLFDVEDAEDKDKEDVNDDDVQHQVP